MVEPVFQLAYVTAGLEGAMAGFQAASGIERFQVNRNVPIETEGGIAHGHFALAFLGTQQIELIEPAGGADRVYRDALVPGRIAVLHHLGFLLPTAFAWRTILRDADDGGCPIPVRGQFGDLMHYAYLDRRDLFGHYLEYMYATPAGASLFDDIPRFPAASSQPMKAIPA
jgi:hypothetical protein